LMIRYIVWFKEIKYTSKVEKGYVWWYYMKIVWLERIKSVWLEIWEDGSKNKIEIKLPKDSEYGVMLYPKYAEERIRWYVELENGERIYTSEEWELIHFNLEWTNVAFLPGLVVLTPEIVAWAAFVAWVAVVYTRKALENLSNREPHLPRLSLPKPILKDKFKNPGQPKEQPKKEQPKEKESPKEPKWPLKKVSDEIAEWTILWKIYETITGEEDESGDDITTFLMSVLFMNGWIAINSFKNIIWWLRYNYAWLWKVIKGVEKVDKSNKLWRLKKFLWNFGKKWKKGESGKWGGSEIWGSRSAVEDLTSLKWKSFDEVMSILKNKWFKYNGRTPWWYDKFKHPDWSEIQIRPNWEVVRVKRVWTSDWKRKYPQRYDENGNPTDKHNTWEFINK